MSDDFQELDPRLLPGGNNPPPDLKVGAALRESLEYEHAGLVARANELLQMAEDFAADHDRVEDDETSGVLAGVIRQILGHAKDVDTTRVGVKENYLEGCRIVDGFFTGGMKSRLDSAAATLNRLQTAYGIAKEDRRRRAAQEAAKRAAEEEAAKRREAARAEQEARKAQKAADAGAALPLLPDTATADPQQRAEDATQRAADAREGQVRAGVEREMAEQVAAAPAAELSRTRGDYAMMSLRTTVKFRVLDIKQVPPDFLLVNEKLVNAAIRGPQGRRDIPGIEVYEEKTAVNR